MPTERVDLALNKTTETLHVACGRVQANVKGINADEFPVIPEPDQEGRVRMEPAVLKRVISQVAFAAATDDSRPSLTGVLTNFEGNRVMMAATDGFRLSVRSAHIAGYVEKPFSVIIPARALNEVARILSDDLEAVYISMPSGRNQIIFDMDNALLVSQLIDGKFPDYQPIIPSRHNTRTVLNTGVRQGVPDGRHLRARVEQHGARRRGAGRRAVGGLRYCGGQQQGNGRQRRPSGR